MIKLTFPKDGDTVSILSDECKLFYELEDIRKTYNSDDKSFTWRTPKMVSEDCSKPLPVRLEWTDDDESVFGAYVIVISENIDLSDPVVFISEEEKFDAYNLCVGVTYYWCVQKGCYRSEICTFTVSDDAPRLLYIDGVSNVRDMGGYNTTFGRIRQKMLYRGSELDNNFKITEKGINELLRLGIKTDLDLRSDEPPRFKIQYSMLSWYGINHFIYSIRAYEFINNCDHMKLYKEIMLKLADENMYPVYLHCIAGADRTGTVAFLIGALLGMSYEDLIDEYELTGISIFGERSRNSRDMNETLAALNKYDGKNICEKVENYMIDGLGLAKSDIERIRAILIE